MTLTQKQLEILQHAYGADQHGYGGGYRNHYCAGGDDEADCRALVEAGLMWNWEREWLPYYNCSLTKAGIKAMVEQSPKPPKLTRAQKRYREWLKVGDLISFGDWLKWGEEQRKGGAA